MHRRAEARLNEMHLEKIAFENRAMHDRHLRTLKALREEVAKQKPTLAAEMEMQLRSMAQAIQTSIEGMRPLSHVAPETRRRKSEKAPSEDPELVLDSGMGCPRSFSIGSPTDLESDIESVSDISPSSGMDLYFESAPKSTLKASENAEWPQATRMLLQQEPTMSVQVSHRQKSQCRRPCSCQCHRSSKFKTPDFLRQVAGQLLIGYVGIPSITSACNEHACAKRQKAAVRVQYYFPVWSLIQRMLTLVSLSGGAYGPEKILRMSRIRPGLDEVFIQVQSGNVRRLQQLFVQGDASPLDASDTGWTLLHYALTAGQLTTTKFLKDAGADVHAESARRDTPAEIAWNRILSGCLDGKSENLLREVFEDDNNLDERQFTTLHKIVLGMIGNNLADELELTTAHINAIDSLGNTPLAWASARGDYKSVGLLLEYGASLGIANNVDAEPIHLAAQTGNINTVEILIKAGADVNRMVRHTKMTPIHYAAEYKDKSEQILALARLGALINGEDYMGWTPLHWASWRGHLASLNALLDCGANVNAKTRDGNASIMLAVANNSHGCVQTLIEAGADCSVVRDSQWNVLHYAAMGGSVDTVYSLAKADLSGLDLQELRTKDTRQTVDEMLCARIDTLSMTEDCSTQRGAWQYAWDDMMANAVIKHMDEDSTFFARPFSRSNTDSVYYDADDQIFRERGAR